MGILYPLWYIYGMTPTYAIQSLSVVSPEGITDAWGVLHEPTETLFSFTNGAPFIASDKACAFSVVRFLNGITNDLPVCTCQ
jgi:hypothetical protein